MDCLQFFFYVIIYTDMYTQTQTQWLSVLSSATVTVVTCCDIQRAVMDTEADSHCPKVEVKCHQDLTTSRRHHITYSY